MSKQDRFNITKFFFDAAEAHSDNYAIIELRKKITYSELALEVRQTAAYFQKRGIGVGDRVMVFIPMSIDLYRTILALFYIGATAVFLDEWVSKARLKQSSQLANCKGFIGTPKANILRLITKELRQIPISLSVKCRTNSVIGNSATTIESSALITFTTGSTGVPKAADRTHGFLKAQFDVLKEKMQSQPGDIDMPMLPIVLFINLGVGATSIITDYNSRKPNSISPSRLIDQLKSNKVHRLTASPFVVNKIAEQLLSMNLSLPNLRQVFTGGAPVFPLEAKLYQRAFPDVDVQIIYGSTEAEPISAISPHELVDKILTTGLPVGEIHKQTNLKILSLNSSHQHNSSVAEFSNRIVPDGLLGEIVVSGDHVLKKYFNNPIAYQENKINVDGEIWHMTGDSGYLLDGKLFLTGRCSQLIKRGETYISPFIIENKIQLLSSNQIGTILEHNGDIHLVVEQGLSEKTLLETFEHLAYDKLNWIAKIPRDPRHHSKIDYKKLLQHLFGIENPSLTN